jgi:hypothetical protein
MYRRDRINERDVPESQHTIFIRGLPGNMTTEEIRDFFGKDTGCTFDFVKVSPDRDKLYVAVRFESKTVARQIMEKCTATGTILGYDVEMSWFRDIRRYLAHCAKQGVRPSRFSNQDSRRNYSYRSGGGGGSGRRSRSFTRSPDRGPSEEKSGGNKSMSRSVSGSRRSKSRSVSRSKSASSRSSHRSDKSLDYSDIVKKERDVSPSPPPKKQKIKRRNEKIKRSVNIIRLLLHLFTMKKLNILKFLKVMVKLHLQQNILIQCLIKLISLK